MYNLEFKKIIKDNFDIQGDYKRIFLLAFGLILLFTFPLIISDHYYSDDLVHSMNGETGWVSNGRPLSEILFKILMAGGLLSDISPMPQLLAAAILALSITFLTIKTNYNKKFLSVISFLPVAISPYYLENWSYKYDSLTMSCAVFFSILPLITKASKNSLKRISLSAMLLFISMNFYQAALNLFVSLSVLFFLINIYKENNKEALPTLLYNAVAYLIANFLYILIIKKYVMYGEYNTIHGAIATGNVSFIKETILRTYALLNSIFLSAFKGNLWLYFSPFLITSLLMFVELIKKCLSNIKNGSGSIWHLLITIASPFIIYVSIFGPMLLLVNPITSARTLIGASGFLCSLFVLSNMLLRKNKTAYWVIAPVAGLFLLAYSLFNAQKTTEKLEVALITRIVSTFDAFNMSDVENVSIIGDAPVSYQAKLAEINYPIIALLNKNNIGQDILWGNVQLNQYYFNKNYLSSSEGKDEICSMKKVMTNDIYTIYRKNKFSVIDFSHTKC